MTFLQASHWPALISQTQITQRLNKNLEAQSSNKGTKNPSSAATLALARFALHWVVERVGAYRLLQDHGNGRPQTRQQRCYDSPKQLQTHPLYLTPSNIILLQARISEHSIRFAPELWRSTNFPMSGATCCLPMSLPKRPCKFGSLQSPPSCYRYPDIVTHHLRRTKSNSRGSSLARF